MPCNFPRMISWFIKLKLSEDQSVHANRKLVTKTFKDFVIRKEKPKPEKFLFQSPDWYLCKIISRKLFAWSNTKGIFRAQLSIYDEAFLWKAVGDFCKKAPSQIFDSVLNRPLNTTLFIISEIISKREISFWTFFV